MRDLPSNFLANTTPSEGGGGKGTRAFSLCEVVIAMGLFVFALLGILGLMPTALTGVRESLDIAVATELANEVATGLNGRALSSPSTFSNYFDDTGNELPSSMNAVYSVVVAVDDSESQSLKRAKITVSRGAEGVASKSFCYLVFQSRH